MNIILSAQQQGITIKSQKEIDIMRRAGEVAIVTKEILKKEMHEGITTKELDIIAESKIRSMGAIPAFKGYRGFTATLCISVNEEIVHGIPGERKLIEGDVVSIDLGAIVDGFYSDTAITLLIGDGDDQKKNLIEDTKIAMEAGIAKAVPGNRIGDIAAAVQKIGDVKGYGVIKDYVGHGIGRALHEEPSVPNVGIEGRGPKLVSGMVLAIEPMFTLGTWKTRTLDDDWTVVTSDNSLAAHWEHTVAITEKGPEVLT
jgi:methionyl aminopeptidase